MIDISKILGKKAIPAPPPPPKPEDREITKAKMVAIVFVFATVILFLIGAVVFSFISKNYQRKLDQANQELQEIKIKAAKYGKFEREANLVKKRSDLIRALLGNKVRFTPLFNELERITPKRIVYTSFSIVEPNLRAQIEAKLGLQRYSLSGSLEDVIRLNGVKNFLNRFDLEIPPEFKEKLDSTKGEEQVKTLKEILKNPEFWNWENGKNKDASYLIDDRFGAEKGTTFSFLQETIPIEEFIRELGKNIEVKEKLRIEGKALSYTDLAKTLVSLENSPWFKNLALAGASLRELEGGGILIEFSIECELEGDLRGREVF